MKIDRIMLVCLFAFLFSTNCSHYYTLQTAKQIFKSTKIDAIDLSKVQDGTYAGYCDMILVTALVRVSVAGGKIDKIDILEHRFNRKYDGSGVVKQVLEKQSLAVDGISGATMSARTMLKAIERALLVGTIK